MNTIPINLAIEDELSEAVLRRILTCVQKRYSIGFAYRHGGFGYLRKTISGWNNAAKGLPFIVLTDLDEYACPSELISDWLSVPLHPNLLFRIAVREIESWVMADNANIASFFKIANKFVPRETDKLADAKATLIDLACKSKLKGLRDAIAPKKGSTAKQGPDYNGCLVPFVQKIWDMRAAALNSPSLARTIQRLEKFKPQWPNSESAT
jgi:hypothetical protein